MNNQELFELRKREVLTFATPTDLTAFLDNLLEEEVRFPLVVGYKNLDPQTEWEVLELRPQTKSDALTLQNYLEGLKRVSQYWNEAPSGLLTPNFSSVLTYNGIDCNDKNHQDEKILGVSIGLVNSARNLDLTSFSMYLYNKGRNYYARTEMNESDLVKIKVFL